MMLLDEVEVGQAWETTDLLVEVGMWQVWIAMDLLVYVKLGT